MLFQFTHPCGCDACASSHCNHATGFNSRTRVGATVRRGHDPRAIAGFNSRTRVGATPRRRTNVSRAMFQFTHPCGCDVEPVAKPPYYAGFNSRTRVGATSPTTLNTCTRPVSIHAPVWVRLELIAALAEATGFQFTHPCGCDQWGVHARMTWRSFNSRTRVGATFGRCTAKRWQLVSIHAPVWVRRHHS